MMKGGFYEEQIPASESPLCVGTYLSILSDSRTVMDLWKFELHQRGDGILLEFYSAIPS